MSNVFTSKMAVIGVVLVLCLIEMAMIVNGVPLSLRSGSRIAKRDVENGGWNGAGLVGFLGTREPLNGPANQLKRSAGDKWGGGKGFDYGHLRMGKRHPFWEGLSVEGEENPEDGLASVM